MWFHKRQDRSYLSVAMVFIIFGAIVFTFGAVSWLFNMAQGTNIVPMPSAKILGGAVLMALGYIQLELGLIRDK